MAACPESRRVHPSEAIESLKDVDAMSVANVCRRAMCVGGQCVSGGNGCRVGEYQAPKLDRTFAAAVAAGFELPRRRYGWFGDVDRCQRVDETWLRGGDEDTNEARRRIRVQSVECR